MAARMRQAHPQAQVQAIVQKGGRKRAGARGRAGAALRTDITTRAGTRATVELKVLADAELECGARVVRAFVEGLGASLLLSRGGRR